MTRVTNRQPAFEIWSKEHGNNRFTDWLRLSCEPMWTRATRHRFTCELGSDILDDSVFRRYLVQDYSFLDSFVRLIGSAVGAAPALADRIPLAQFLGLVTSDENTYFQRAFNALDISQSDRSKPDLLAPTRQFHAIMDEAARSGRYADMLAVLVVTEWVYLDWATSVASQRPARFYLAEWIDLHANDGFAIFVAWLREQLDREGTALDAGGRDRVLDLFRRTVGLEEAFFDAAYV